MESGNFEKEDDKKKGDEKEGDQNEGSKEFEIAINSEIIKLMIFTLKNERRFTRMNMKHCTQHDAFTKIENTNEQLKNSLINFQFINNDDEWSNLNYFLSKEEINHLKNLHSTILDEVFNKFTEIMKERWNKTVGDLNPDKIIIPEEKKLPKDITPSYANRSKMIVAMEEITLSKATRQTALAKVDSLTMERINSKNDKNELLRTDSITDSINKLKLAGEIGNIIIKINKELSKNSKTSKYSVHDLSSHEIIIGIFKSDKQIKHLTFHNPKSENWRGSAHFRKEDPTDNFSGNAWYNNRLRFNQEDCKFKLDYDLDEIENTIIRILNEDDKLILNILNDKLLQKKKDKLKDDIERIEAEMDARKKRRKLNDSKNKYLKYKNKYLQLKKIYNTSR